VPRLFCPIVQVVLVPHRLGADIKTSERCEMINRLVTKFKEVMDLHQERQRLHLVLMAHPDVTVEQLVEANKLCVITDTQMKEEVTDLRKKYTSPMFPWNKPEFDKYDMKTTVD
jgi:hypothetical protein